MTTHVPEEATARLLLDGEAIAKSLARIAHELIERNAEPADRVSSASRSSGSSRVARRWRRGCGVSWRSEAA